jgi:hypothetical protein
MSASRNAAKSGLIDCTTEEFKQSFVLLAEQFGQENIRTKKMEEFYSVRATRKRRSNTTPPATTKRRSLPTPPKSLSKKDHAVKTTTPPATTKRRSLPTPPKSLSKKDHAVKTTCASPSCDEEVEEIGEQLMFGEDSADEVVEEDEGDEGEDA